MQQRALAAAARLRAPVEFAEEYYRGQKILAGATGLSQTGRREHRDGSIGVAALALAAAARRE